MSQSHIRETEHRVHGLFVKEYCRAPSSVASRAPILMIHGGCHGWWAFEIWGPLFAAKGARVFALSLRNHTDSDGVPTDEFLKLTVADYVHDVAQVVAWLPTPPILIGHSMGGLLAQKAAETTPVPALVLVSSVGPGQLGSMRGPLPEGQPVVVDAQTARTLWFHRIEEDRFRRICGRLVPESPSVVNEYSRGDVRIDRERISCPILVIGGECDRSPVHAAGVLAAFYGAECIMIPHAGHDLMLEDSAEESAMLIARWLDSASPE